jgi:N-acetylmuramoyl-L-alanine amidase
MNIEKHFLVEGSSENYQIDTSRATKYGVNSPKKDSGTLQNPDTVVLHYTASNNINSDIRTLYESTKEASVQFLIDTDGKVYQLMPANRIAWHAGKSRLGNRTGMNKYSIGIEIVNPGYLVQKSDGSLATWYNEPVKPENAIKLQHKNENFERFWHIYTHKQIDSVKELCQALYEAYNINNIVGHDDVSPGRKQDPGPAFPLNKITTIVLDDRNESLNLVETEKLYSTVKVDNLNIRQNGNANAKKIALPLAKGQQLRIIEEKNGWCKVETTITGWVKNDYIE